MDYNLTVWKDHIKDQFGNVIQQGTPASAKNLNNIEKGVANLTAQIEAAAEMVRESTPSGFTTLGSLDYSYMSTNPNTIKFKSDAVAYVNGYKTVIPAGTVIPLSAPPTTGSREDLVFLECWKEADANGVINWKWRLRVVDGVDFSRFPEGLGYYAVSPGVFKIGGIVQGSNNAILDKDIYTDVEIGSNAFTPYTSRLTLAESNYPMGGYGDVGLYIAGRSGRRSYSADGYVYAIPMFRVSRRNSGGYSVNNGNGSDLLNSLVVRTKLPNWASNVGDTNVVSLNITSQLLANFSVGDVVKIYGTGGVDTTNTTYAVLKVTDIDTSAKTITLLTLIPSAIQWGTLVSSKLRKDLLLADTIAERDIKPLWHEISLTGFNTQQLLEENFDKLLRGELQTKEKTQMVKTYHGVRKTPVDANTIFYASLDGSVNAEVGSTLSYDSSSSFVPSPTGLALLNKYVTKFKSTVSLTLGETYTIDFWVSNPQVDTTIGLTNEDSSKYFIFCVPGNNPFYYVSYDLDGSPGWELGVPIPKYTKCHADFNRVRLILNTSTGALKVFVNGKLELNNSTFVKSTHLSYLSQLTQIRITGGITVADLSVSNVDRGDVFATLPKDFVDGYARLAPAFNSQRKVFSDALTSQYTSDIIKAAGVNAKQITTTQKTAGVWTAGDTIKVKGLANEIISGVIDSDTAIATVTQSTINSNQAYVDDVSKISVNDEFVWVDPFGKIGAGSLKVTSIDVTNKTVTFDVGSVWNFAVGGKFYETTALSSSPTVKFNNAGTITPVVGTWSGLGTNEATFTLATTTGLNAQDLQVEYSLNMPAGQGGMTEVLTATLAGEYQGKKLAVNPAVHIRDDFAGKKEGSVVECPHVMKYKTDSSSLLLPNSSLFVETNQAGYDYSRTLDGVVASYMIRIAGAIPQLLLQFNIIREIEDRMGPIPALDKIAWIKDNVASITCNAHAFGSCPDGNKINLTVLTSGTWNTPSLINTASIPTLISLVTSSGSQLNGRLQSDEMLNFLLYTDPAKATDGTAIALSNHGLSKFDLIENVTRGKYALLERDQTPNSINLTTCFTITGQVAGDTIKKFKNQSTKTATTGTNSTTLVVNNHGLSTGDWIQNQDHGAIFSKVTVVDSNTLTLSTPIPGQTSGDSKVFLFHYIGTQIAEDTVIPSQINLDYAYLDIVLKTPTGYDILAPENPRRDDGRSNMLLVRKETKEVQAMFNASNTDGVITYGDYIPKQGLLPSITDGYMLTTPKMCITSLSTKGTNMLIPYGTKNDILDEFLAIDNLISTALTNGANINSAVSTAVSSALIDSDIIGNSINYKKVGIGKIKALSSKGGLVIEDSNKGYFVVSVDISKVPKDANVVILSTALIKDSTGNLMMLVIGSSDKLGGYVGQVASSRFLIFNIANRPLIK